jgi:hypothetical protein
MAKFKQSLQLIRQRLSNLLNGKARRDEEISKRRYFD